MKRGIHLEIDDRTVVGNDDTVVTAWSSRRLHVPVKGVLKVRVLQPPFVHRVAAACTHARILPRYQSDEEQSGRAVENLASADWICFVLFFCVPCK